ncbi:MAG: metal ABC transporter permease [candidate division KSB1 bacterium]|nr:metal ABC transporter permease [candidate division KSB1 bacterium]
MIDLLTYTFMQRALVMATVTGTLCALIGVYVVLRHMSFIGAGIAHASFGGVAIGLLIGIQPFFTSVVFCSLTAYAIGYVSEHHRIREDTAVGIFFASTMALGVLLIGFIEGYNPDLFGYIFGNVLAVTRFDVIAGVVLLLLVGGILFYYFKEFMFLSFDPAMARVIGLPVRRLNYMMLTLIALTIVISIKAVGIVLVSALIVTPAAAAHQWTQDFRRMMFLAVLFGVGSSWIGLFFSAALNLPSGATIVLTATFVFLISSVFSPQTRKLKRHRRALQQKLQQETG